MFLSNTVILVGRIVNIPTKEENEKYLYVTIDPTETDMILDVAIPAGNLSDNLNEYCKKGDLLGIKGHIDVENNQIIIVADRVTFMAGKSEEGE